MKNANKVACEQSSCLLLALFLYFYCFKAAQLLLFLRHFKTETETDSMPIHTQLRASLLNTQRRQLRK